MNMNVNFSFSRKELNLLCSAVEAYADQIETLKENQNAIIENSTLLRLNTLSNQLRNAIFAGILHSEKETT